MPPVIIRIGIGTIRTHVERRIISKRSIGTIITQTDTDPGPYIITATMMVNDGSGAMSPLRRSA
jgi:hypothetical protein